MGVFIYRSTTKKKSKDKDTDKIKVIRKEPIKVQRTIEIKGKRRVEDRRSLLVPEKKEPAKIESITIKKKVTSIPPTIVTKSKSEKTKIKVTEPISTYNVSVKRGGDWTIENNQSIFLFKVKVENKSKYVISSIQVIITSVPPGLKLISERVFNVTDLSRDLFVSPTFKFAATESCVGNIIEGFVSFRDYMGEMHTVHIKPLEIKYVCNLLVPKHITENNFEKNISFMEEKKLIFDCDLPPFELEEKLTEILEKNNFFLLDKVPESKDADFRKLKGYAEGKYDKTDVALQLMMQKIEDKTTKLVIKTMSDREEKIMDILSDLSKKCEELKTTTPIVYPSEITCEHCDTTILLTEYMKTREVLYCEKCGKEIKISKSVDDFDF